MGEVYLAVDEKLGRRVALKTLPQDLADDPIRRKRFERESTVLAGLSHPFVVTVHAVEEVGVGAARCGVSPRSFPRPWRQVAISAPSRLTVEE